MATITQSNQAPSNGNGNGHHEPEVDYDALKALVVQDNSVRAIFESLLQRKYARTEVPVHRIETQAHISYEDTVKAFRALERVGAGVYKEGRRNHPARFKWSGNMLEIVREVLGRHIGPAELHPTETRKIRQRAPAVIEHHFYLRQGEAAIALELPADLSVMEADRLAAFIKSLPFH